MDGDVPLSNSASSDEEAPGDGLRLDASRKRARLAGALASFGLGVAGVCARIGSLARQSAAVTDASSALLGLAATEDCATDYSDDCRSASCCNEYSTCFEKSEAWAACRPTCALGFAEELPPWAEREPWTCKILAEARVKTAPQPVLPAEDGPSMFCFLVSSVSGNEPELLRRQFATGSNIFACDSFAIFSVRPMVIGPREGKMVQSIPIGRPMQTLKGITPSFILAWAKIKELGLHEKADFSVKAEPDAVYLPSILRAKLANYLISADTDKVYFKNCEKSRSMQGPLQVLSKAAALQFAGNVDTCQDMGYLTPHGEDWFLGHCLELLHCRSIEDYGLLEDLFCTSGVVPSCTKGMAAYHPFKSVEAHVECLLAAQR